MFLATHVAVRVCRAELKVYLLTYHWRGPCSGDPKFLADRTNGRAIATLLCLSSVVCDVMYCG